MSKTQQSIMDDKHKKKCVPLRVSTVAGYVQHGGYNEPSLDDLVYFNREGVVEVGYLVEKGTFIGDDGEQHRTYEVCVPTTITADEIIGWRTGAEAEEEMNKEKETK